MEGCLRELETEIGNITMELDRTQKEITRCLISKIESFQDMLNQGNSQRELILEKTCERIMLKENGRIVVGDIC